MSRQYEPDRFHALWRETEDETHHLLAERLNGAAMGRSSVFGDGTEIPTDSGYRQLWILKAQLDRPGQQQEVADKRKAG